VKIGWYLEIIFEGRASRAAAALVAVHELMPAPMKLGNLGGAAAPFE